MATLLPQNQWFTSQPQIKEKKQINESWIKEIEITKLKIDYTNVYKQWEGSLKDPNYPEDKILISAFNLDPSFNLTEEIPTNYIPKIKIIINNPSSGFIYLNQNSSYLFSFPKANNKNNEEISVNDGVIKNFENLESITGLENLDININVKKDNTYEDPLTFKGAFQGCTNLTKIDLSKNKNFEFISDITYMFNSCSNIKEISLPSEAFIPKCLFTSFEGLFQGCSSLRTINDPSKWNVSKITNMKNTFAGCRNLARLEISQWDVSKVTTLENFLNMNYKVSNSTKNISFKAEIPYIKGAGESNLKVNTAFWKISSSCINLEGAFSGLGNTFFDFSSFDTSKVTTMKGMCKNCSKLERVIGLHKIDDTSLINIDELFYGCSNLTALNMSAFGEYRPKKGNSDVLERNSNKISCKDTLTGCSNLTKLTLGFRFKKGDSATTKIILPGISNWFLLEEEKPNVNKTCKTTEAYLKCPNIFYKTQEAATNGRNEKVIVNRGYLSDIGYAIREKIGSSAKNTYYLIREMPNAIRSIK